MDPTINEDSTAKITLAFTDATKAPVTPTAATWRLDDELSGAEVVGDTQFTPTAATHLLVVPYAANRILADANRFEPRLLTVTFFYTSAGLNCQGTAEFRYVVKNLFGKKESTP